MSTVEVLPPRLMHCTCIFANSLLRHRHPKLPLERGGGTNKNHSSRALRERVRCRGETREACRPAAAPDVTMVQSTHFRITLLRTGKVSLATKCHRKLPTGSQSRCVKFFRCNISTKNHIRDNLVLNQYY